LIIVDDYVGGKYAIKADVVNLISIRFSIPITGPLEDVDDKTFRTVRIALDEIATEAAIMLPYDNESSRYAAAVKFSSAKILLDYVRLTDLSKEVGNAIEELRRFNRSYRSTINELLKKNNCLPA
jgi:hypothetical protein